MQGVGHAHILPPAGKPLRSGAVLVLLPPSEGKARPARSAPADLSRLAHPELAPQREVLLDALAALAAGPVEPARAALGLSAGQVEDIALNAALRTAPAAPAARVYTGVLYERLRLPDLPAAARRRVLIASALWGVVRPNDRIPAYRLSMDAKLPGLGGLAAWWRPALTAALPDDGLIVDLRSGTYAAAWKPRHGTVLAVRALAEHPDGRRTVISHMAKRVRGDVARVLLTSGRPPRSAGAVIDRLTAAGMRAEPTATGIDVIEPA
jgi:cytoplasmic iron level regulating protein YaaA (DUF328/UPF0246 family)